MRGTVTVLAENAANSLKSQFLSLVDVACRIFLARPSTLAQNEGNAIARTTKTQELSFRSLRKRRFHVVAKIAFDSPGIPDSVININATGGAARLGPLQHRRA